MSWTYSPANISSSALSFVRFKIGDTTSGRQLLQDEEILGALADLGDQYYAAAACARAIGATFGTRVDKSVGKLRIAAAGQAKSYEALARQLQYEADLRAPVPYAGGISQADKQSVGDDTDRVLPQFSLGMTDLPGLGVASSSEVE